MPRSTCQPGARSSLKRCQPHKRSMNGVAGAQLTVRAVGGPTLVLDLGGLRLLTDPTFDPPGAYEPRPGVHLTKTQGPAVAPDEIEQVDVVLLSHDQHRDNLDDAGRAFLARAPLVLTTVTGAERLRGTATALPAWETIELDRPEGDTLRITAVPAQHGPDGSEGLTGEVTGFLLAGDHLPTVYVSGDNASLDVVRGIAERFGPVDVAVLFAGGAQLPYLGDAYLTLPSASAADAALILGARHVVPAHHDGWQHLSNNADSLRHAFAAAGIADRLVLVSPGATVTFGEPASD
jgi:L-ascorbate metabolism protein UlaG (beta-lactamase superfamily)